MKNGRAGFTAASRAPWRGAAARSARSIYIAAARTTGRARPAYIGAILAVARAREFPADYVAALAAIASTSPGVRPASRSARKVRERSRLA